MECCVHDTNKNPGEYIPPGQNIIQDGCLKSAEKSKMPILKLLFLKTGTCNQEIKNYIKLEQHINYRYQIDSKAIPRI